MPENRAHASGSIPMRPEGDLQLQLNLAPLRNARSTIPAAPSDALRHILDSVPFTPSQGVRTPSPRRSHVRY